MLAKTLSTAALLAALASPALAGYPLKAVDVSEDHTRFIFAPAPVFEEDGMPAYGNPFLTQGYIYPAGTLANGALGTLKDGSPAFPEKVLGTWTCDGWFVADGAHTKTGTWLISRQTFEFRNGEILITQGDEIADVGVANARAITGGTGDYADIEGVVMQTLLGFNEHMGVAASFEIGVKNHEIDDD